MEMQGLHLAFGIRFQYAIAFLQKNSFSAESEKHLRKHWRCGALLPETLACEARALPFDLHPHCLRISRGSLAQSATMRFFLEGQ